MPEPTPFPAPASAREEQEPQQQNTQRRLRGDGKTWAEWKRELSEAIEQLDYACSEARRIIYKMRPLLRSKGEKSR